MKEKKEFGCKQDDVATRRRKPQNDKVHNLYAPKMS
jgi:acyl-CoA-binding protein